MTTQEPEHGMNEMRDLASDAEYAANEIGGEQTGSAIREFVRDQSSFNKVMVDTFDEIKQQMQSMSRRMQSMTDAIGILKGGHARNEVVRNAELIAFDLGIKYVRDVAKIELAKWAQTHSNSGIEASDLRSFREADLVIEAHDGSDKVYVAVEISFTADKRDTDRAIRNAGFLHRFTGYEAHSVVASVQNDRDVAQQVEQGLVHWYEIDQSTLRAD